MFKFQKVSEVPCLRGQSGSLPTCRCRERKSALRFSSLPRCCCCSRWRRPFLWNIGLAFLLQFSRISHLGSRATLLDTKEKPKHDEIVSMGVSDFGYPNSHSLGRTMLPLAFESFSAREENHRRNLTRLQKNWIETGTLVFHKNTATVGCQEIVSELLQGGGLGLNLLGKVEHSVCRRGVRGHCCVVS